jgi:hypothetical protein
MARRRRPAMSIIKQPRKSIPILRCAPRLTSWCSAIRFGAPPSRWWRSALAWVNEAASERTRERKRRDPTQLLEDFVRDAKANVLLESTVAVDTGSVTAVLCLWRCTLIQEFFTRSDDRPINTRVVPKLHVLHKRAMDGKHVSRSDSRRESMSTRRTTCDVRPRDRRSFNDD